MAELSAAVVSGERRQAEAVIGRVDAFVRSDPRAHIVESETAFL